MVINRLNKFCDLPTKLQSEIINFAHIIGVKLSYRDPEETWGFNGESIATDNLISNIIHDIAHFMVCPIDRRNVKDFGLGQGPDSGKFAPEIPSPIKIREEEAVASILGILIEKQLNINWIDTAIEHFWASKIDDKIYPNNNDQMHRSILVLLKKGIILEDLTVHFQVLTPPKTGLTLKLAKKICSRICREMINTYKELNDHSFTNLEKNPWATEICAEYH